MHDNRRTAITRQTAQTPPPDVREVMGALPERAQPVRVVQASNQPSTVGMTVIVGLFITSGSILAGVSIYKLFGVPGWVGFIAGFALWLIAGVVCLIILNGDLPAVLEIKENEKTERKRVSAAEDIAHRHYDLAEKSEEHRHLETMAHIHADQRLAELQDHMRAIYDMVQRLTLDQQALPKTGSFTVQRSFPAREAVADYLLSLYGEDGKPSPEFLHPKGHIKFGVPWRSSGGEWNRETWGQEAVAMLTKPQHGQPPVILPVLHQGQNRGWQLNIEHYPTKAAVIAWVSRFKV